MVREFDIETFLDELSSNKAIPGGGGASALAGAFGCSLGLMMGSLTTGKKRYLEVEEEIKASMESLEGFKETFLRLADKDEEVFLPLSKAYGLPKTTEEEIQRRNRVMETLLYDAAQVPMSMMETAIASLREVQVIAEKGSKLAVSDGGVAASYLRTALEGASLNVRINANSMKNDMVKDRILEKTEYLLKEGFALYEAILTIVNERM